MRFQQDWSVALISLRRSTRNHFQIPDLGETRQDFFLDAIGENALSGSLLKFEKAGPRPICQFYSAPLVAIEKSSGSGDDDKEAMSNEISADEFLVACLDPLRRDVVCPKSITAIGKPINNSTTTSRKVQFGNSHGKRRRGHLNQESCGDDVSRGNTINLRRCNSSKNPLMICMSPT
jgi:hypothetical protein